MHVFAQPSYLHPLNPYHPTHRMNVPKACWQAGQAAGDDDVVYNEGGPGAEIRMGGGGEGGGTGVGGLHVSQTRKKYRCIPGPTARSSSA